MTEIEFKNYLKDLGPVINVPKGKIDKQDKRVTDFISFYKNLTGKKLGEGTCKDCILDAYFELLTLNEKKINTMLTPKKYVIKPGKMIGFKTDHYLNTNITDAIALEMVAADRRNAGNFVNGDELLADYDNSQAAPVKAQAPAVEKKEVTDPAWDAEKAAQENQAKHTHTVSYKKKKK